MEINPANPGHVLVIPKVHAESILTIEEPFLRNGDVPVDVEIGGQALLTLGR